MPAQKCASVQPYGAATRSAIIGAAGASGAGAVVVVVAAAAATSVAAFRARGSRAPSVAHDVVVVLAVAPVVATAVLASASQLTSSAAR